MLIKELEKKNRQLKLENEQQKHKIEQLQENLEKSLKEEMGRKQCQECLQVKEIHEQLSKKYQLLSKEYETNKVRLKEQ